MFQQKYQNMAVIRRNLLVFISPSPVSPPHNFGFSNGGGKPQNQLSYPVSKEFKS